MKLSNIFIKKKINELANNSATRTPRFCSINDAHDILIVFSLKDKDEVLECVNMLREYAENIHLCAYVSRKKKEDEPDVPWLCIYEDDLDSKGVPVDNVADRFCTLPADILIDLSRSSNYAMHYLQLRHPSLFKVGDKSLVRDLTIPMGDDVSIRKYFEQILYYLLTIRSK